MEAAILESLRRGHSIRAACAAAGCALRTYQRFAEKSSAHRHDREVAMQEAERRLVGRVLDAADDGDVKAAQWLLERRWPQYYAAPLRVDAKVDAHHEVDAEVLVMAQRYSGLTADEVEQEIKRLGWVVPNEQPAATARVTAAGDGQGGEGLNGEAAILPAPSEAQADKTADTAGTAAVPQDEPLAQPSANVGPDSASSGVVEQEPLEVHVGPEPIRCIHCRGTHEATCPHAAEGTFKIDRFAFGDPR